jgi:integrase
VISPAFTSWLSPHLRAFVAVKRAVGYDFRSEVAALLRFDRHVRRKVKPPLLRKDLLVYLEAMEHLAPRSRDNVVSIIWPALEYAKCHGARVRDLPPRPPSSMSRLRQRQPRILDDVEFAAMLSATARLTPTDSYRPITAATLIRLLWVTGLRIGEAVALDVGDIDFRDRLLVVRAGKFGKSRVLPVRESTLSALDRYLDHPQRQAPTGNSAPLFTSQRRRRLCRDSFHHTFGQAWTLASIPGPRPRVHDLRHAFAVRRVAAWYAAGQDVNARLPALSTYLGRVSVENTRLYLVANSALLLAARARFERGTSALDEVLL